RATDPRRDAAPHAGPALARAALEDALNGRAARFLLRVCERIPSRRQAADASRIAALLLLAIASGYDSSSRLALRAPRPPGSVRGFIHKLSVEAVERRRVPPRNGRPLFGGDVLEVLRQRLARVRPRRVAVRGVGRPPS